jgi:hypothetical protein
MRGFDLADDFRFTDAGRIESGGNQKQMFGRAFPLPGPESSQRLTGLGQASGQKLEGHRPEIGLTAARPARKDQFDAVAGRNQREFGERIGTRELRQAFSETFLGRREVGQRLGATLPPGNANHAEVVEQSRLIQSLQNDRL